MTAAPFMIGCTRAALMCCLSLAAAVRAEEPATGRIEPAPELPTSLPWDLAALSRPPAVEWLDASAPVRSLLYAGEPFQGRPTRVFAYYATPASIGDVNGAEQAAAAVNASKAMVDDRGTRCRVTSGGPVASAALVATNEPGPINKLTWQTLPAEVAADGTLTGPRPPADARAFFFTATTPAGLQVSSPAVIIAPDR